MLGERIIGTFRMLNLKPRLSRDGELTPTARGWIFRIPAGPAHRYRLSQLDDHLGMARTEYPWRPPMRMQLEARASAEMLPGTWGFGLWNDPYGFSFGPGNGFLRLPALPQAAWFFFSSPTSYLSFRDDKPANGLLAQLFAGRGFSPVLFRAVATLPFWPKTARQLFSRVVLEDAARVGGEAPNEGAKPPVEDVTQWHKYGLEWMPEGTVFHVDETPVLRSLLSPRPPMGLVIWIDNQYAGFTPQGKLTWGLEENLEPAWVEIRDLVVE